MCFTRDGDYDWLARACEDYMDTATKPVTCQECFRRIPVGEKFTHIEMREWECCRVCDPETRAEAFHDDDSDNPDECPSPCADDKHDYGNTDEHRICADCQKLLTAIQHVEEDDGCKGDETRPGWGELRETFWESDHAQEYIDRARQDYPELAMSGYLDDFYGLTREWQDCFEGDEWFDCEGIGEPVEVLGGEG